ncbi:MAG: exo-alpha-sialidase [Oscillospiraceae bacterium]|jgi:predicted neuraminidase|nr:exo-alpha-sialidase [Oscillospiraceae bacterium]
MIQIETKEFVFTQDTIAPSCHASTVLPLPSGTVLSAFFAGEREGADDVRIWVVRRANGVWETPICIPSTINLPHWNPVLDLRSDGTICLYYKIGKKVRFWRTYFVLSKDEGKTWTAPQLLVPEDDKSDGRGPVKDKCIRISNGTLLAPASTELKHNWRCFIDISKDDGSTWEKQKFIVRLSKNGEIVGMIQPTLWESENGHIHALMRTNGGNIYRSDSKDYGVTWRKAYATSLPNNNSGIDCVKDDQGRVWLLYNPSDKNWGPRSPLTLAASTDNGITWSDVTNLETEEGWEFSYPAITFFEGCLHMTYTYNRKTVAYVKATI